MLSEEHAALRATVEDFARKEIAPVIAELYERGTFPYAMVAKMGEMGLFGLPFPAEYGGMGGDYFALCLALEELARVDSSVAITLEDSVSLGAMPIFRFGTEEQKQRWLPELCTGQGLGAFGLTEPGGGSDAGATRTTARCDDEEWVINGSKAFITNSGTDITSVVTVTAITGVSGGRKEISTIMVPARHPGCIDECVSYARQRHAFGHAIGSYQAIQFKIADMEARTHAARLTYYHAARRMLRGEPFKKEAAIAKLVSSNAAMDNARDATQVFGGYGFMNEYPVARFYRDAKVLEIGEGTSEVQRILIARHLGVG